MGVSGCSFNVLDKVVTARPGFRLPGTSYLEPDGDRVTYEGMEPRDGEMLLIIRVRPADSSAPSPPWERGDD